MIAKIVKGRGFRGALEYVLSKGYIIDTNMAGRSARELAKEFGAVRRLRPSLKKAVFHASLSAAPGERLTDEQWREVGQIYLRKMGFADSPFVIIRHTDTGHEHAHIVASRIAFDGSVVSDSQDYRRQEAVVRDIERVFGLRQVAPSAEAMRRALTRGEIEVALRTGRPSARQQLQRLCDAAAKGCSSFTEYVERLEAVGVEVVPTVQMGGAKLSGLLYRLDGVTMKGSDLGRGYTAAGIQKRGIVYEQNRDLATVERCRSREARRALGEPDREPEAGQAPERGGFGRDAGAAGPGYGGADRRGAADAGRDRPQEQGAWRDVQAAAIGSREELQGRGGDSAESCRESEPSRAEDEAAALPPSGGHGLDHGPGYCGARERILALASPAQGAGAEPAGRASRGGAPEARRDRSLEAVRRQIAAMGVPRFEVGIRDAKTGKMMNREWGRAEIERAVPWLKRMNAMGNDVYIRPAGEHGLVLLDDLKPQALERMKAEGFAPAATIETSPGNFQAWVKLSDKPLSADVRRAAARWLAKRYGGDLNSADSRHYGRLAGFTNRKPQYARGNLQPYVLAHDCPGTVASAAPAYLERIEQHLAAAKQAQQQKRPEALQVAKPNPGGGSYDPARTYQRLMQLYGPEVDISRLDWKIAVDMARLGHPVQTIEKAIREHSPKIEARKAGHVDDYIRRTVQKAWQKVWGSSDVQDWQEQEPLQSDSPDSPGM